jgi:Zn ribbon nucleic-acid-binding protein
MKILFDDAVRFLIALSPSSKCPACSEEKWIVPYADEEQQFAFLTPLVVSYGNEPAYNLALECAKCGFVREHRARFVEEWIAANPVVAEDE